MRSLRLFGRRLLGAFGRGRQDDEIDEELRAHRDMLAAQYRKSGMNPSEAERAAAAAFGPLASAADDYRAQRGLPRLEHWVRDVVYAVRSLRRTPAVVLAMVLVLGLGIGLSTAIATVLHSIAWQPLPVPDAQHVVKLSQAFGGKVSRHVRGQNGWFSYPELMDYRAGTRTLDGIAGIDEEQVAWQTATNVRAIGATLVTGDYFTALRATPARGRLLTQSDAERPVAVVSHRFWRQSLNSDNEVVGGQLVLDRTAYTVVGVADASFAGTNAVPTDVWLPLEFATRARGESASLAERDFSWLQTVARLARRSTLEQAVAEAQVVAARLDDARPEQHRVITVHPATRLDPALRDGHDRDKILAVASATGVLLFVLLAICGSNVAALLLARGASREKELAIRVALGAGRGRLAQQLIAEVLVLAAAASTIGVAACVIVLRVLEIWLPVEELIGPITPGVRTFLLAAASGLAVMFVFGIAPVRQALRIDTLGGLKGDRSRMPVMLLRRVLLAAQVATSLVLLVGAAWLTRGVARIAAYDPGFVTSGLWTVQPDRASPGRLPAPDIAAFTGRLRAILERQPGVEIVGAASVAPFGGLATTQVHIDAAGDPVPLHFNEVDRTYFDALGVRVVAGRFPTAAEPDAGLVNASLATTLWGSEEAALGHLVEMPVDPAVAALRIIRIVGVVPALQTVSAGVVDAPMIYLPLREGHAPSVLLVRAATGTQVARLAPGVVQSLSPGAFARVMSVEDRIERAAGPARLGATIAGLMGLLGLIVSSVGIHGIVAHAVAARTREIGIRLALGAPPRRLLRAILGSSLRSVAVGAGMAAALLIVLAGSFSREFKAALFGLDPLDPAAFAVPLVVLAAVVLTAAYLPARRALDIAPTDALRREE